MKENVLDVLMFLFENYLYDEPEEAPDRDSLEENLHQAGFTNAEIEKAFLHAAKAVVSSNGKRGTVHIEGRLDYESFAISTNSEVVQIAKHAIESLNKVETFELEPQFAITNGGIDANWLNSRVLPTVSLGCGQRNQHMVTEELHIDEYLAACRIALTLARGANNGS